MNASFQEKFNPSHDPEITRAALISVFGDPDIPGSLAGRLHAATHAPGIVGMEEKPKSEWEYLVAQMTILVPSLKDTPSGRKRMPGQLAPYINYAFSHCKQPIIAVAPDHAEEFTQRLAAAFLALIKATSPEKKR